MAFGIGLPVCSAAEWSNQPYLELYLDRNSNRLLSTTNELADFGEWLIIDDVLERGTESGKFDLHPQLEVQRFSGNSTVNATSGSLQASAAHSGEQFSYSGGAIFSDRSTLISEIADTGIINGTTRQQQVTVTGALADQFTEQQSLAAQATYSNVKYPGGEALGLEPYHNTFLSATYSFSVSAQTALSIIAFGNDDVAPTVGNESRSEGLRAVWAYSLSPSTDISAAAGFSRATLESKSELASIWAVQARHDYELTSWTFSFSRDISPSGLGLLTKRDEFNLSALRHLSPRLDATLSAVGTQNRYTLSTFAQSDRRYISGNFGISYHISMTWLLALQAGASSVEYPQVSGTGRRGNGWQTLLSLTWKPTRWSVSR